VSIFQQKSADCLLNTVSRRSTSQPHADIYQGNFVSKSMVYSLSPTNVVKCKVRQRNGRL